MHVRRALLLFAIVLVIAALAASISAPRRDEDKSKPPTGLTEEATPPAPGPPAAEVRFSTEGKPVTRRLEPGASARVEVAVDEPGQVELEGLGQMASAVPGTPAVFELLVSEPGRHPVLFESARTDERERIGTLVVERPQSRP